MTDTKQAKYKAGDRLYFRASLSRAPFGTAIPNGVVTVTEVVDHSSATPYSPRFTYVVRARDGRTQGTDDRELTENESEALDMIITKYGLDLSNWLTCTEGPSIFAARAARGVIEIAQALVDAKANAPGEREAIASLSYALHCAIAPFLPEPES